MIDKRVMKNKVESNYWNKIGKQQQINSRLSKTLSEIKQKVSSSHVNTGEQIFHNNLIVS